MSENRQRIVKVTRELLMEVLKFPPGTRLVDISCHVSNCFISDTVALKIEGPDFEPVPPGGVIPEVSAEYRSVPGTRVPEFVGFKERPTTAALKALRVAPRSSAGQQAELRAAYWDRLARDVAVQLDRDGLGDAPHVVAATS